MKKIVLTLSLMLCATAAFAQIDFSQIRFGARAGFGLGMVDLKQDGEDTESQAGFQVLIGGTAELPVWKFLRVTGEVYFEHTSISDDVNTMYMTGSNPWDQTVFTHTKVTYPINYIHVPIMARACFVKDFIFVEAGPQFGFLVGKIKTHTEGTITYQPNASAYGQRTVQKVNKTTDETDSKRKVHTAFNIGWGGNFGARRQFSAGFRIGFGLNDLQDKDHKIDGMRVTHSDFQVSMRYWF